VHPSSDLFGLPVFKFFQYPTPRCPICQTLDIRPSFHLPLLLVTFSRATRTVIFSMNSLSTLSPFPPSTLSVRCLCLLQLYFGPFLLLGCSLTRFFSPLRFLHCATLNLFFFCRVLSPPSLFVPFLFYPGYSSPLVVEQNFPSRLSSFPMMGPCTFFPEVLEVVALLDLVRTGSTLFYAPRFIFPLALLL